MSKDFMKIEADDGQKDNQKNFGILALQTFLDLTAEGTRPGFTGDAGWSQPHQRAAIQQSTLSLHQDIRDEIQKGNCSIGVDDEGTVEIVGGLCGFSFDVPEHPDYGHPNIAWNTSYFDELQRRIDEHMPEDSYIQCVFSAARERARKIAAARISQ